MQWANIGRVIYGASEDKLRELVGVGNYENYTMSLPCRVVFGAGQKNIEVWGPVMESRIIEECEPYWRSSRESIAMTH